MANTFSIPPNYYKSGYRQQVSKRYLSAHQKGFFKNVSFHISVYLGYYLALILGIAASAYYINTSGLASKIMTEARYQQQLENALSYEDHSTLNAYFTPGSHLLITFSNQRKVGESEDGVRFRELSNDIYFSEKPLPSRFNLNQTIANSFFISKPPPGHAQISFSCTIPGKYTFALEITERSGLNKRLFYHTLSCSQAQYFHYSLNLDSASYHNLSLTPIIKNQ